MGKLKEVERPVAPKTNLLDDLEAIRPRIENALVEGDYSDVIRAALSSIDGAIDHLRDARWQNAVLGH
jgi:hypothetical protein